MDTSVLGDLGLPDIAFLLRAAGQKIQIFGSLRIIELAFTNLLVSNCMVAPAGSSAQDVYL